MSMNIKRVIGVLLFGIPMIALFGVLIWTCPWGPLWGAGIIGGLALWLATSLYLIVSEN